MEKLHSRFAHLSYKMLCIIIFTYLIYMIGRFTTAITFFFKKKKTCITSPGHKGGSWRRATKTLITCTIVSILVSDSYVFATPHFWYLGEEEEGRLCVHIFRLFAPSPPRQTSDKSAIESAKFHRDWDPQMKVFVLVFNGGPFD